MSKIIMGIQLEQRMETANSVQNVLTEFGCFITTRIGLHQTAQDYCSEKGLIILELVENTKQEAADLEKKLSGINGVIIKKMEF